MEFNCLSSSSIHGRNFRGLKLLLAFLQVVRILSDVFQKLMVQGVAASSSAEIFAHWSTLSDRFVLTSVINSGALAGAMLSYPISGTVAYYLDWRAVFYVTGMSRNCFLKTVGINSGSRGRKTFPSLRLVNK